MSLEFKTFLMNSYGALESGHARMAVGADVFRIDVFKPPHGGALPVPIYVAVTGLDRFVLDLPLHDEIEQLVRAKGGEMSTRNSQSRIRVTLETTDYEFVLQLSSLIRERVDAGQEDSDSNEESIEPHTAQSLRYFAGLLKQYSVQTRGIEKTRPDGLFAY